MMKDQVNNAIETLLQSRDFAALVTAARTAQRGAFLIALYSTPAQRQALVAALRARVVPQPLYEFAISPQQPRPLAYLEQIPPAQREQRAVICLYDVEAGWPDVARWLDRQRDRLAAYPHTLILWIEDCIWGKLVVEAPNFFSRHGGVFDLRFPALGDDAGALLPAAFKLLPEPAYETVAEWEQLRQAYETQLAELEAEPLNDRKTRIELHLRLGYLYAARAHYPKARYHFQKAYALIDQDGVATETRAEVLYQIGRMRYYAGEMEAALESYRQALALFRQVEDRLGEANTLKAVGDVQRFQDENGAALESYGQAVVLFRQVGDRLGEANTLLALGTLEQEREHMVPARDLYQQALSLYEAIDDRYSVARALIYQGDWYAENQKPQDAAPQYEQAAKILHEINLDELAQQVIQPRLQRLKETS